MKEIIPYINGAVTLTESVFNVLGYLPKDSFPEQNSWGVKWRTRFGACQAVAGITIYVSTMIFEALSTNTGQKKYLTLSQQATALGIVYLNHGLYNIVRAYIEGKRFGVITAAYDFYGRKFLPPISEQYDLQGILFEKIRNQLDCVISCQLLPPSLLLRSY